MQVVVRVDASLEIGTGHVMRCLTLARVLRDRGADVLFICREDDGHCCGAVESAGFSCSRLPARSAGAADRGEEDARQSRAAIEAHGCAPDLLIVDHYALDQCWESILRPVVGRICVIDDLANRRHDCDLLLDQNLHDAPDSRYSGLIPRGTRLFLGPKYALLRPEFDGASAVPRTQGLRRMMVFFGGVDTTNEAVKIVQALRLMGATAPQTDIVLGPANPHVKSVLGAVLGLDRANVVSRTENMAALMRAADLGIGTCGVAAWERCSAGLPSLIVISADNQRDDARILDRMGAARCLGEAADVNAEMWVAAIQAMQADPAALQAMSVCTASVMQGRRDARREFETALVA